MSSVETNGFGAESHRRVGSQRWTSTLSGLVNNAKKKIEPNQPFALKGKCDMEA